MTEKTIYLAFDGTQFSKKDDCMDYEIIYKICNHIKFWDRYGDEITFGNTNEFQAAYDCAMYIETNFYDDFELFTEMEEYFSLNLSGLNGLYVYNDEHGGFDDANIRYKEAEEYIEVVDKIRKGK